MRRTIRITIQHLAKGWNDSRLNISAWWVEIGGRGHKIFIGIGATIVFGVSLLLLSLYLNSETKEYYRDKIEKNEKRLERLEKEK